MNTEFKVGQKVYSLAHGWGEVDSVSTTTDELYPVCCSFAGYCKQIFTKDGRLLKNAPISLYHYEPEIIAPKWQPKEGEWCCFWDNSDKHCVLAKFEAINNLGLGPIYGADLRGGVFYDNCAPFIGELPEHLKNL